MADSMIFREGVLGKRIVSKDGMVWKDRHVTLTDQHIYISNEKGGVVRDFLHLRDLSTIERHTNSSRLDGLKKKRSALSFRRPVSEEGGWEDEGCHAKQELGTMDSEISPTSMDQVEWNQVIEIFTER